MRKGLLAVNILYFTQTVNFFPSLKLFPETPRAIFFHFQQLGTVSPRKFIQTTKNSPSTQQRELRIRGLKLK